MVTAEEEEWEIPELSPLEVSDGDDCGYQTPDTTAGTSLNVAR